MPNVDTFAKHEQEFRKVLGEWGVDAFREIALMRLLIGSARLLEVLADHALQKAALSLPRLRLLLMLGVYDQHGNKEGVSPSKLSHFQHVSKNTVSSLLASLEEQGLVERTLSREDKRSFNIRLTKAGREVMRAAMPEHGKCLTAAFADLSNEEQRVLLKLLEKLRQSLMTQVSELEFQSYKTSLE